MGLREGGHQSHRKQGGISPTKCKGTQPRARSKVESLIIELRVACNQLGTSRSAVVQQDQPALSTTSSQASPNAAAMRLLTLGVTPSGLSTPAHDRGMHLTPTPENHRQFRR